MTAKSSTIEQFATSAQEVNTAASGRRPRAAKKKNILASVGDEPAVAVNSPDRVPRQQL